MPHKLRPLNIIIASSTEIAAPWYFSCLCGLPWCWYRWFFIILKKLLYSELSCDERHLQPRKSLFFSLQESSAKKVFALGWWKIVSISTKANHTDRKNLESYNFSGRGNYKYSTCAWQKNVGPAGPFNSPVWKIWKHCEYMSIIIIVFILSAECKRLWVICWIVTCACLILI